MAVSTLTLEGKVPIPEEVRQTLRWEAGDKLVLRADPKGELIIRPAGRPLGRAAGLLRHLAHERPVTVDEMKVAIRKRAAAEYLGKTDDRS